jgi:hypothetical protein
VTPGKSEAELAAERLIKLAGSKRRAHKLIDIADAKGEHAAGRELSRQYVDQRLIGNAMVLETLWRRIDFAPPTRRELVKRQVEACWRHEGTDRGGRRKGRWDDQICSYFVLGILRPDLGGNPQAVLRRFDKLPEIRLRLDDQGLIAEWSYDSPTGHGKSGFWKNSSHVFGARVAPESWLWLHLQHPDWGLLPPDVKWGAFDGVARGENI